jgi:hypothetical protein
MVGWVSAWKANAHVSLGPVNVLLGIDPENVPLAVYEIVSARAGAQQQSTKTGNNSFSMLFMGR